MWLRVNSRKGHLDNCESHRKSIISRPMSVISNDEPECVSMPNYGLFLGKRASITSQITSSPFSSSSQSPRQDLIAMPTFTLPLVPRAGLIALIGVLVSTVVYFVLVNDRRHAQYAVTSSLLVSSVEMLLAGCSLTATAIGVAVWPRCRGRDGGAVAYRFDDSLVAFSFC